jgi:LuxR family maltose regulon positive regulatory protein
MDYYLLFDYVMAARVLMAQENLDEAARLLQGLLEQAEKGGRRTRQIEILLLQALTADAQGAGAQALVPLEQALSLAEPEGFVRAFVDEGPPMARLLYRAASAGRAPGYVGRLLSAFPSTEPQPVASAAAGAPGAEMIEPLSERELEVLLLIAEGLTNQEIAARLFLSLNTVKGHTRNIYGKLGVHSRTQAVSKARTLGLLPFA